jgi:hypothetical protein
MQQRVNAGNRLRNNLLLAGVFWNLSMFYLEQGGMTNGSRWRRTGKCTTLHRQDR